MNIINELRDGLAHIPLRVWALSILMSLWVYIMTHTASPFSGLSAAFLVLLCVLYLCMSMLVARLPFGRQDKFHLLIIATIFSTFLTVTIFCLLTAVQLARHGGLSEFGEYVPRLIDIALDLSYSLITLPFVITVIMIVLVTPARPTS